MAELSSPAAVLEIGTAASWVRKCSSLRVRAPVSDGFWMLSALWLAPVVLLLVHGYSNPESSLLDLLYIGLTVDLGTRANRSRIRDRIHSLLARSKHLSNVGPASAGGSVWPR
jgi:hypothetical protein